MRPLLTDFFLKSGRLNYGEDTAMGRPKKAHTCSMGAVVKAKKIKHRKIKCIVTGAFWQVLLSAHL